MEPDHRAVHPSALDASLGFGSAVHSTVLSSASADVGARARAHVAREYAGAQFAGLDGRMHGAEYFLDHQGAAPFVKPKQEGFLADDENAAQLRLDSRTGESRIRIERQELGSFFDPAVQVRNPWGAPSAVAEIEERMRLSASTKQGGVNPFEQIRVGPGGATREQAASNAGFNAGMEWRDLNGGKGVYKTVDELRIREKFSGMNKPGLGGVAEYSVKRYDPDAAVASLETRESMRRSAESAPRGPEHWAAAAGGAAGTVHLPRSDDAFVVAGWESDRKRSDNAHEYFGNASLAGAVGAGELDRPTHAGAHEPARTKRHKKDTFASALGNAGYRVDPGATEDALRAARDAAHSRAPTNRGFNNAKYMDGTEHTFLGAATDMLKGVTIAMGFGGDTSKNNKRRRLTGNPRPLANPDARKTQRLGGVVYDPQQGADVVRMADLHNYSVVGNPDRGAGADGYLTASLAEAVRPKESTFYDEHGSRLSNARATGVPDPQEVARDAALFSVPDGAERKERLMAYDYTTERGGMLLGGGSGYQSSGRTVEARESLLGVREYRSDPSFSVSASTVPAPRMVGYDHMNDIASRELRGGMYTRTVTEASRDAARDFHPAYTMQHVLEKFPRDANPFRFSHSEQFGQRRG